MKRARLFLIALIVTVGFMLTGCSDTPISYQEAIVSGAGTTGTSDYLISLVKWDENGENYEIVYATDTKVKYLKYYYWGCERAFGGITPLYNADGSLQIYGE